MQSCGYDRGMISDGVFSFDLGAQGRISPE
jgi:hypothetical protein